LDFRFPVQYVIRDQKFRGYAGTVVSGMARPGDEIVVLPSGRKTKIKSIKTLDGDLQEAFPPLAVVFEVEDNLDISRGDILVKSNNLPTSGNIFEAMIVWMNDHPLRPGVQYSIKHNTSSMLCSVESIRYKYNINTLKRTDADSLDINEIGRVVLTSVKPLAFDSYSRNRATGCFILIDRLSNQTVGAGMIMDRLTIDKHIPKAVERPKGFCLWLTGLSGSGKTTIGVAIEEKLRDKGLKCERLDGDVLREEFKEWKFSKEDRTTNVKRIMFAAKLLSRNDVAVIASFISPYAVDREYGKKTVNNFIEVFVKCPISECERRDPKGLYKKVRAGEIKQFTGIDDPYEEPQNPDLVLETDGLSIDQCVDKIYEYLIENGLG